MDPQCSTLQSKKKKNGGETNKQKTKNKKTKNKKEKNIERKLTVLNRPS